MKWSRAVALACALLALGAAPAAGAGWLAPVDVSLRPGSLPRVAVSDRGETAVLWRTSDADPVVQAAIRTLGTPFAAPVDLTPPGAYPGDLQMNAAGDAIALTLRPEGAGYAVGASLRVRGGSFAPAVDVSGSDDVVSGVRAALGADGSADVYWVTRDGVIRVAHRPAGGSFAAAVDASAPIGTATYVSIAATASGDAVAVWESSTAVRASIRTGGGSFGAPVALSPPGEEAYAPVIAIAANGSAVVSWAVRTNTNHWLKRAALRAPGQPFGTAFDLSEVATADGTMSLAMAADGTAIATWEQFDTARATTMAAVRPAGGTFSAPVALSDDGWTPAVAMNARGDAVLVWRGSDPDAHIVTTEGVTRPAGGSFSAPRRLTAPGEEGFYASAAVDSHGEAAVAWHSYVGADLFIRATWLDATPPQLTDVTVPATAPAGTVVGMQAAAADAWSAPVLAFDFGDGASGHGGTVTHAYAAAGTFTVTVTATDAAGNTATATRTIAITGDAPPPAGPSQPPASPAPELPAPVFGERVTVRVVSGRVLVRRPGRKTAEPLGDAASIPVGSLIDARHGSVRILAGRPGGRTQTVVVSDGQFTLRERRKQGIFTEFVLAGGSFAGCPTPARASAAAGSKKKVRRKLWTDGAGDFRVTGRYGNATVRGTRWLTADRCDGTLFDVRSGTVAVRDFARRRTVVVRAKRSYLARARR